MNPFLQSNKERVNQYFLNMVMPSQTTSDMDAHVARLPHGVREMALVNVHRHLHMNANKLIKLLAENQQLAKAHLPKFVEKDKYLEYFKQEIDHVLKKCGDPPAPQTIKPSKSGGRSGSSSTYNADAVGNNKIVEKLARKLSAASRGDGVNPYQSRRRTEFETDASSNMAGTGLLSVDLTSMVTGAGPSRSNRKKHGDSSSSDGAVEDVELNEMS